VLLERQHEMTNVDMYHIACLSRCTTYVLVVNDMNTSVDTPIVYIRTQLATWEYNRH